MTILIFRWIFLYMLSPASELSMVIVRCGVCRLDDCIEIVSLVSCGTAVIARFNPPGVRGVELSFHTSNSLTIKSLFPKNLPSPYNEIASSNAWFEHKASYARIAPLASPITTTSNIKLHLCLSLSYFYLSGKVSSLFRCEKFLIDSICRCNGIAQDCLIIGIRSGKQRNSIDR